jgi:hypothetical protein
MSEALPSIRNTSATPSVRDSPNPTIAAPQHAHATIVTRPCRRTYLARPLNSATRSEPTASAAYGSPISADDTPRTSSMNAG